MGKQKLKYYVFFYQEKFLEVRSDYRFNMYLKFLYGKVSPGDELR